MSVEFRMNDEAGEYLEGELVCVTAYHQDPDMLVADEIGIRFDLYDEKTRRRQKGIIPLVDRADVFDLIEALRRAADQVYPEKTR